MGFAFLAVEDSSSIVNVDIARKYMRAIGRRCRGRSWLSRGCYSETTEPLTWWQRLSAACRPSFGTNRTSRLFELMDRPDFR